MATEATTLSGADGGRSAAVDLMTEVGSPSRLLEPDGADTDDVD